MASVARIQDNAPPMNHSLTNISGSVWGWLTDDLRRIGIVISLLLSTWVILTNDTVNADGVLYLDAAYQIKLGDWGEALKLYRWLFYPVLIAVISKVTTLGVETTALLISVAIFATIIWVFLSLLMLLNASRSVLIAGLIIISVHPHMNEYRADISRDSGYWMLFLWSIYFLIRLQDTQQWKDALLWGASITLATLFRIDGVAYATLAPIILLFGEDHPIKARIQIYLKAMLVPFSLGAVAFTGILLGLVPKGRLHEPFRLLEHFYTTISNTIPKLGDKMVDHILHRFSSDFGTVSIYSVLLTILILMVIKRSTILFLAAGCYTIFNRHLRSIIPHTPLLAWFAVINLITLTIFVASKFFLSSRFAMPFALIIALFASYAIARLFSSGIMPANLKLKMLRAVVIGLFIILTLDGLYSFGDSKRYIRESGEWLKDNLSHGQILVANDNLIYHYSGIRQTNNHRLWLRKFGKDVSRNTVNRDDLAQADYIAIRTKHAHPESIRLIESYTGNKPIKEFNNDHGKKVSIYKRSANP